jgi:glycosyltransferase involved in cell wall biosynthesis
MAAGLPVLTTAIGSEGMGLEDGHSARIVDDPEPFAQATIELYSDREAWTKIAQGGRELLVENFSAKKAGNELRTLFDMVAESQGWRIS